MAIAQPSEHTIVHLPAAAVDWAGILTQFTLKIAARQGRSYAAWAAERMLRLTRASDGLVMLADGQLRGIMLVEIVDDAAELTLPWAVEPDKQIGADLSFAMLEWLRGVSAPIRYIRAERQLLPGAADPAGMEAAGFCCHWRQRMVLEMMGWRHDMDTPPAYRLLSWQTAHLDAAAQVVYRANLGSLDAVLYAPFFGDSPTQCRKGILAILAGRYGPIHPRATLSAFHGDELVGVNLVIDEGNQLASVVEISVDPAHQSKRIGRLLMARSLKILDNENFQRVELAVTVENTRARALYSSLGFNDCDRFPVCVWPRG